LLKLKNIFHRSSRRPSVEILKDINIELKSGDFFILRGARGSGKTSLLKIASLNERPASGSVLFNNKRVEKLSRGSLNKIKSGISFINEDHVFINSKSLSENLKYVLRLEKVPEKIIFDRSIHVLQATGLISKRDLTPALISSGEKKLFALALALARETDFLICDLNLTGHEEEEEMVRLLKNTAFRGAGIIVTAKDNVEYRERGIEYLNIKNGEII